jgi:hypothetical protein
VLKAELDLLPRVQELASAIQEKGHDRGGRQRQDAAAQKQSSRKSGVTNRVADSHNTQRLGAKHPSDSAPAAATLTTNPSDANESPGRTSPNPQRFRDAKGRSNRDGGIDQNHSWVSPSLSFYDLKKELLTSARNQARQSDATLTDNEAIACAADAILRNHGILVQETGEATSAEGGDGGCTDSAHPTEAAVVVAEDRNQRKKNPHGKISFESLAKAIGRKWQSLSSEEVQYYKRKSEEDKDFEPSLTLTKHAWKPISRHGEYAISGSIRLTGLKNHSTDD